MTTPVAEGEVLAGKYRIERVLGQGGMGVVVAATHLHLNQRVAIKLMQKESVTAEAVERFLREARASVRLKSEHVARVIDVGEAAPGVPYMVMEYLEGSDLSDVILKRGALPVKVAVEFILHACEAIAEAHAAGIIHRDLKPANLFLTRAADGSDTVKVLDFGISKALEPDGAPKGKALTATTAVFGSPAYMSPEQMRSARDADVRSDLWSLGVILYELLAGSIPFDGATYPDLVLSVNMQQPAPFTTFRTDVPEGLQNAVFRCLAKKRDDRFANIAELATAIAEFGPPEAEASARRIARTVSSGGPPADLSSPSSFLSPLSDFAAKSPLHADPPEKDAQLAPGGVTAASLTAVSNSGARGGRDRWLVVAGAAMGAAGAVVGLIAVLHARSSPAEPLSTRAPDQAPTVGAATPVDVPATQRDAPLASATAAGPEVTVSTALPPAPPSGGPKAGAPRSSATAHATGSAAVPPPATTVTATAAPVVAPPPTIPKKKNPFDVTIK